MIDSYGDGWNGNTFDLVDVNGEVAYSVTLASGPLSESVNVCVAPGCYSYSVDGGSYQYEIDWEIYLTDGGAPSLVGEAPASGFITFGYEEPCNDDNFALGCLDPWASNYDPTATADNGSCEYSNNSSCETALDIVFDTEFAGQSLFNNWFSFSNANDDALLLADINGGLYDLDYN